MERCTKRHYANTHIKYQITASMKSKNGYVAKMLMSAADTISTPNTKWSRLGAHYFRDMLGEGWRLTGQGQDLIPATLSSLP